MIDAIKSRLNNGVPELADRVRGGGDLAALLARGSKPSAPIFAYVLYGGLTQLGKADIVSGAYRQPVREVVNIVLFLRADDADGERAIQKVQPLQRAILGLLCGWAPGDQVGVLQLARSAMISFTQGFMGWQIDLTITDQLRITP